MAPARRSASQPEDGDGHSRAPPEGAGTGTSAAKRRGWVDKEHGLVDQGKERLRQDERALLEVERRVADRIRASTTARVWSRLNAVDFMNSSMQFAALALLCLLPFLTIVAAASGGDARPALARRLGLDGHAARDVNALMSQGTHAVATLDVFGGALLVLGAIGVASTLQTWYQKVYDRPPQSRWIRQMAAQILWLAGFVVYLGVQDLLNRQVGPVAAKAAIYAVFLAVATVFYWWTQHVLLLGRVRWGQLLPGAMATAVCVTGLAVFSTYVFSGQIVSGDGDYGPIGVVTVLLSYLVGFGVCLHLGAVVGQVWTERKTFTSPAADQPPPGGPPAMPEGA